MLRFGSKSRDRAKAEAIIELVQKHYNAVNAMLPNRRELFYLAPTWIIYAKTHHPTQYKKDDVTGLMIAASGEVLVFSLLNPPNSIHALSYFLIHKERLTVASEYEPGFNEIMQKLKVTEDRMADASRESVCGFRGMPISVPN